MIPEQRVKDDIQTIRTALAADTGLDVDIITSVNRIVAELRIIANAIRYLRTK